MKTLDYLHLNETTSANVVASLKQLLADFQVHYMNLRGFHWNIKGRGFFVLHAKFEELYNDAAEKVDQIAERILMLGGSPSNKFSDYLNLSHVAEIGGVSCGDQALGHILEDLPAPDRRRAQAAVAGLGSGRRSDRLDDDRLPGGAGENGLDALRLCRRQTLGRMWQITAP